MASISEPRAADKPLDRKTHLAAQLLRNRAYYASLLLTTIAPCPPYPDELAAEIARVAAVIRLIEADLARPLSLAFVADNIDVRRPRATDYEATLPRCSRCGQPFALIHLSVYPAGLFCPGCDRARMADSEVGR